MITKNINTMAVVLLSAIALSAMGCTLPMKTDPYKACVDARVTLLKAADDKDAFTRTHAIEAMGLTLGAQAGKVYIQALSDPAPPVRFAAAMAVAELQYMPAKKILVQMAEDKQVEPDRRVYTAVIYALYRLGDLDYVQDLGSLLIDKEPEVRADAAMVMGRMRQPAAIDPLRAALGDERVPMAQLQMNESLALLGDNHSMALLEAYARTTIIDERLVAIPALGRIGSTRSLYLLRELAAWGQPPRVRVSAADALAKFGEFHLSCYNYCVDSLRDPVGAVQSAYKKLPQNLPEEVSSLRQLAAMALGDMGKPSAVDVLHPLLNDNDGGVRVAAAMGILKLLPGYRKVAQSGATMPAEVTPAPPQATMPATMPATGPASRASTAPSASEPAATGPASWAPETVPTSKPGLTTAGAKD